MGAGNVKAARTEPAPLRLGSDLGSHKALQYRAHSGASSPRAAAGTAESRVSAPLSALSPPLQRRWDVTCNVHRSLICRFCGGKSCKREDWKTQKETPAIRGLHSTWVSANVLGMQRLSTRLIREYGIIDQFKKAAIGAVINLQLAGEHPHCGDGIDATGFSYRAEDLTDAGIYYYNPGWVDMDIPSLERMVEVVQIMSFHTERAQKVAVHCFAEGHQLLTNRGFLGVEQVRAYVDAADEQDKEPLRFATLNRDTHQIEYQEAEDFIFNPASVAAKPMVELSEASSGVSLLVTDGHDMLVQVQQDQDSVSAQVSAQQTDDEQDSKALMRTAGSLLDEAADATIKLTAAARNGVQLDEGCATALPFIAVLDLSSAEVAPFLEAYGRWVGDRDACGRHPATRPEWIAYFAGADESADEVPSAKQKQRFLPWVWRLDQTLVRSILLGLASTSAAGSLGSIRAGSASFRDEVVRAAMHAGYVASVAPCMAPDANPNTDACDAWDVSLSSDPLRLSPTLQRGADIAPVKDYHGATWCVTVPNGTVFARRAGDSSAAEPLPPSTPVVTGNCHAGYGRTGIVIACFFVYAYGLGPEEAIASVRTRRPGSVQTARQKNFVAQFHEYVSYLRTLFYPPTHTPFALKHGVPGAAPNRRHGQAAGGAVPDAGHSSDDDMLDDDSHLSTTSGQHPHPYPQHSTGGGGVGGVNGGRASAVPPAGSSGVRLPGGMVLSRKHSHLLTLVVAEREAALANRYTLHEALSRQRAILHGAERNSLKFLPKLLSIVCARLQDLSEHKPALLAAAFLEGFRRGGNLARMFDEEREREKERKRVKAKAAAIAAGGGILGALGGGSGNGGGSGVASKLAVPSSLHQQPLGHSSANGRHSPSPTAIGGPHAAGGAHAHAHDDGGLASLSTHGVMAQSRLWDLGGAGMHSSSRTMGHGLVYVHPHGAGQAGEVASLPPDAYGDPSAPRWGLIQDAEYAELQRRINAGDWTTVETCDIRYCAQLLLEWLDGLRVPLLPLFERAHHANAAANVANSGGGGTSPSHLASGSGPHASPAGGPSSVGPLVAPVPSSSLSMFSNPHSISTTPAAFFSTLPRWTLHSLEPIMTLLYNMRNVELGMLARVYARFGFALTHPRAQIPESLLVRPTVAQRSAAALAHRLANAGLSLQVLHQAAQASLLQQAQQAQAGGGDMRPSPVSLSDSSRMQGSNRPGGSSGGSSGASGGGQNAARGGGGGGGGVSCPSSSGPNFDAFHHVLPAHKSLLDSLVEFLASFARHWGPLYTKLQKDEARMSIHSGVGVRKAEWRVEASLAQRHAPDGQDADAGAHTQLRPYQAEPTKLVTQVHGDSPPKARGGQQQQQAQHANQHPHHNSDALHGHSHGQGHHAEQTAFDPASREVSTTAYLKSRIHDTQPQDRRHNAAGGSSGGAAGGGGPAGSSSMIGAGTVSSPGGHSFAAALGLSPPLEASRNAAVSQTGHTAWPHSRRAGDHALDGRLEEEEEADSGAGGSPASGSGRGSGNGHGADGEAEADLENSSNFDVGVMSLGLNGATAGGAGGAAAVVAALAGMGDDEKERMGGFLTQRGRRAAAMAASGAPGASSGPSSPVQADETADGDADSDALLAAAAAALGDSFPQAGAAASAPAPSAGGLHTSSSASALHAQLVHSLSGVALDPMADTSMAHLSFSSPSPSPSPSPPPPAAASSSSSSSSVTAAAAPASAPSAPSPYLHPRVVLKYNPAAEREPEPLPGTPTPVQDI